MESADPLSAKSSGNSKEPAALAFIALSILYSTPCMVLIVAIISQI
jgi:hypothetical protein